MSRLGTCKHAWNIQEMWRVDPATGREQRVVDASDEFTCQYLDTLSALPPPIARRNGGFDLEKDDCDRCPLYEPPDCNASLKSAKGDDPTAEN
jgi:hypothetical protein